jgi:predicted dienelactone hydrolase
MPALLRLALGFLASFRLLVFLPVTALGAEDLSAQGSHPISVLEFPNLTDPNRPETASPSSKRILRFPRLQRQSASPEERRVPIKVHFPTQGGPFPLVIVSHGAGGDWDTHYAQAQHLASYGYAVLCLEHTGSNRDRLSQGLRPMQNLTAMIHDSHEVLARPADVGFAITQAEAWNQSHEKLRGKFDPKRIAVIGHSFGAFTTMLVCGMRPALDWLSPTLPPGKGLGPVLRDPRVQCGVALSPQGVGEPFFLAESFASLQAPLLGISGTQDKQQNGLPASNRLEAFQLWPKGPHQFVWIENAKHLDFTDSTGSNRQATPSPTRQDVQPTVRVSTLLFLNHHLKGEPRPPIRLTADTLKPYLRGSATRVEVNSK